MINLTFHLNPKWASFLTPPPWTRPSKNQRRHNQGNIHTALAKVAKNPPAANVVTGNSTLTRPLGDIMHINNYPDDDERQALHRRLADVRQELAAYAAIHRDDQREIDKLQAERHWLESELLSTFRGKLLQADTALVRPPPYPLSPNEAAVLGKLIENANGFVTWDQLAEIGATDYVLETLKRYEVAVVDNLPVPFEEPISRPEYRTSESAEAA